MIPLTPSRPQLAAAPPAVGTAPYALMADFGREQLAATLEASANVLRGLEAVRAIQQRASQAGSARHRAAARQLRSASDPVQLVTAAAGLWQGDLEAAFRAWQECASAVLEVQAEALESVFSHTFDAESALAAASAMDALDVAPRAKPRVRHASRRASSRR